MRKGIPVPINRIELLSQLQQGPQDNRCWMPTINRVFGANEMMCFAVIGPFRQKVNEPKSTTM